MYEDYTVDRSYDHKEEIYSSITLHFYYGNREELAVCRTLADVAAAIDDFSTDFCDYGEHLFVALHGLKKFVPCNFSVECEVKK